MDEASLPPPGDWYGLPFLVLPKRRRKRMQDFVELLRVAVEQTCGDVTKEFRVVDDLSEMQNDFFQEWEAYCEQWQ